MAYIDDKLDIAEQKAPDRDVTARARLNQLMQRWGYGGPLTATAAKSHKVITIRGMLIDEEWVQDGDQPGVNWKEKIWRKTK